MTIHYLADHTLLLALPAFAPAVVVVAVVVWVAMRDRRDSAESDDEGAHSENGGRADQDGPP